MILVTGSTGIVGTRLLFDLIKSGVQVRALKRKDSDTAFVKRVFQFYYSQKILLVYIALKVQQA